MNSQARFSVGQNIEKLYEEIFEEVHPRIKNKNTGVLSKVIYILEPNKLHAKELCQELKIEDYALLEDELSMSADIVGLFITNPTKPRKWMNENIIKHGKDLLKNARKFGSHLEDTDMKLFQIVVIGCIIVGAFVCIKYIEKAKKEREVGDSRKIQPSDNSPPRPKVPVPVALCLVVPASVVGNLRNNNLIDVSDIENLIDSSLYFLCTSPEDANATQELLEITDEDITTVSEKREVYVRIKIADGEEMIEKKVPYILKRNLPSNRQGEIKQLACLKYLSVSGLEKFNRV